MEFGERKSRLVEQQREWQSWLVTLAAEDTDTKLITRRLNVLFGKLANVHPRRYHEMSDLVGTFPKTAGGITQIIVLLAAPLK